MSIAPASRFQLEYDPNPGTRRWADTSQRPEQGFLPPEQVPEQALSDILRLGEILDEMSIPWFISDGTLLGAMREGGFIPGDMDIDIKIPAKRVGPGLVNTLTQAGFRMNRKAFFQRRLFNLGFSCGHVQLDISGCVFRKNSLTYHVLPPWWGPRQSKGYLSYTLPYSGREQRDFLGVPIWYPSDPEHYLTAAYGEDWKTPAEHWDPFFSYLALSGITGQAEMLNKSLRHLSNARGWNDETTGQANQ